MSYKSFTIAICLTLLTACDLSVDSTSRTIEQSGLHLQIFVNQHNQQAQAQASAAVFQDGSLSELYGGDIFLAKNKSKQTYLKTISESTLGYAGVLELEDDSSNINVSVTHEPNIAREDRWYPVDLLLIDPGPGELVGTSATLSLPDHVEIISPTENTTYLSYTDTIDLQWTAVSNGENMQALARVDCSDGLSSTVYSIDVDIGSDDGNESIPINSIIIDTEKSEIFDFISDFIGIVFQALLNTLSLGAIDPDYVEKNIDANPAESSCDVQLFLLRVREGSFSAGFDSGTVNASTSSDVNILYTPPANLR